MAGTRLIWDRLFQIFLSISFKWSCKLAVDLQKNEELPVSHLLISYTSNLPSGPLGPRQIGNNLMSYATHVMSW